MLDTTFVRVIMGQVHFNKLAGGIMNRLIWFEPKGADMVGFVMCTLENYIYHADMISRYLLRPPRRLLGRTKRSG